MTVMERQMVELHRCCSCLSRLSISQQFSKSPLKSQLKSKAISRSFTTTQPKSLNSRQKLDRDSRNIPAYPYDIPKYYKQSWTGLYHGKKIRFGNNVPDQGFTITRRAWRPNIQHKNYAIAGRIRNIKVNTDVIRQVSKNKGPNGGSLKKYLLSERPHRLKQLRPFGWKLRWKVLTSKEQLKIMSEERKHKYGLPGSMKTQVVVSLTGHRTTAYRLPTYQEIQSDWDRTKANGTWKSLLPQFMGRPTDHVDNIVMSNISMDAIEERLVQEDVSGAEVKSDETAEEIPGEMIPGTTTLQEVEDRERIEQAAVELQGSEGKNDNEGVPEDILVNEPKPVEPKSGDLKIM